MLCVPVENRIVDVTMEEAVLDPIGEIDHAQTSRSSPEASPRSRDDGAGRRWYSAAVMK